MQHERNSDNIRIGAAFRQNNRSFDDIAEEIRGKYDKMDADLGRYFTKVAIVDACNLQTLYIIHQD